ncbi:MAG TPA: c-type cytochrome [Ktedonobacterales bacterium]|nr:c-type cytochrome [Ktedonobacterales bacterium]
MGNNRNPGFLFVVGGVALAVIFALLGFTSVLEGRIAYGLMALCLVTAALVYTFYSRTNVVEKTGYGALIFIIAIAFIIPFLLVNQQQQQAGAANDQYKLTLQRGATLFGQYCASCHGFLGQGLAGPQLNNNPAVNKLTNDDITRVISAGVPANFTDLTSTKLQMPAWSDRYGGSLTDADISYLVALIRSSDPAYRTTNKLENINGFSYVLATLSNPTQIAEFHTEATAVASGSKKPAASTFTDLTKQTTVEIQAQDTTGNSSGYGWFAVGATPQANAGDNANITIKVGTVVTWSNKLSHAPHSVVEGVPPSIGKDFGDATKLLMPGTADVYTFTFTKPGDYPFYCGVHPGMIGWITVVA